MLVQRFRNAGPDFWFYLLFAIFIIWQSVGIFPLRSYEADAMSIAGGCEHAFHHGLHSLGSQGYGYWMQPLTFLLIYLFKILFPFCSCESLYCIISAVFAIGFQCLTVALTRRLSTISRLWILCAMVLVPESYALSMYPNSTAIAGFMVLGAFCLLYDRRIAIGVLLLSLAPGFRSDVLMIYPLLPLILAKGGITMKRNIILTTVIAAIVAATTWIIYRLMNADLLMAPSEYSRWTHIISGGRRVLAFFGFYGLITLILLPAGVIITLRHKHYHSLAIGLGAIILVHAVEFRFGNAAKHFALLLPFVIMLSAPTLAAIYRGKILTKAIFVIAISLYGFTGIRLGPTPANPYSLLSGPAPEVYKHAFYIHGVQTELVIGAGQPLMTSDEIILLSGQTFYPLLVHNIKTENELREQRIIHQLEQSNRPSLAICGWDDEARFILLVQTSQIPAGSYILLDSATQTILERYTPVCIESTNFCWDAVCRSQPHIMP